MNNLLLTLASVVILAVSQSTLADEFSPAITYDKEPIKSIEVQTHARISEIECLASVIHHESRGETTKGKIAVGYVVLNRVKSKLYPKSICGVAFQPRQFTGLNKIKYDVSSMNVAFKVLQGLYSNPIAKSTHFHTTHVSPKWSHSSKMKRIARYGSHIFYQFA